MNAPGLRYLVHDVTLHPVRNEKDPRWTLSLYCVLNCTLEARCGVAQCWISGDILGVFGEAPSVCHATRT